MEFFTKDDRGSGGLRNRVYRYHYIDQWYYEGYDLEDGVDYIEKCRYGYGHLSLHEFIKFMAGFGETRISKEEYDDVIEKFQWAEIK